MEIAILGLGCFWGPEIKFNKLDGVIKTEVGYCGGNSNQTNYNEVCTGETNHAEVVKLEFDPTIISYEKILEIFFKIHDSTTLNSQGPDFGTQYRSEIFYLNDQQKIIAKKMIEEFRDFDATIKEIIKFINKNKNTLLIVTADHETGGLQILKRSKNSIKVQWSTGSHTAAPVGVFSYGPGAEIFEGTMDNTDIHNKILNLLSFSDLEDSSCKY